MPRPRVTLCLAVTEPPRMAATVSICAALEICDILPVISDRVDSADVAQWQQHAINSDASASAGSSPVPSIPDANAQNATRMLDAVKSLIDEGAQVFVLWEHATRPSLAELIKSLNLGTDGVEHIAIVVGPRLGLSQSEVAAAVSIGARTATIGSTVVGNHVAAIAGLMVLEHVMRH